MNQKRQEVLRLCAERPRTARELAETTGDQVSTVNCRIQDLMKMGALRQAGSARRNSAYLYESVRGWRKPGAPDYSSYKPLGICVWGVWM
jgi:predicted HTH transcriptional regulator